MAERERPFAATLANLIGTEKVKFSLSQLCQGIVITLVAGTDFPQTEIGLASGRNEVNTCLGDVACPLDDSVGKLAAAIIGGELNGIGVPTIILSKGAREHPLASSQTGRAHIYTRDGGSLSPLACGSSKSHTSLPPARTIPNTVLTAHS